MPVIEIEEGSLETIETSLTQDVIEVTANEVETSGAYQLRSEKGEADGYASLDEDGLVPTDQLPPSGVTDHGALTGLADDDHPQYVLHEIATATGSIGYNAFSYGAGEDYLLVGSNLKYDGAGAITRYSTSEQAAGFEVGQYSFALIALTAAGVQSSPWAWNAVTNVIEVSSWIGIKKNAAPADGDIDASEGVLYWQNTVGNARPIHRGKDSAGTAVTRTPANLEQANEHSARNKFPATYGDITTDADAATITIDWSAASRRKITLTANRTIAFSNEVDGQSVVIIFVSGGTGAFVPVWPAGIRWQGGAAPTLTNTSGRRDLVGIYRESSGNYIGTFASDFY